MTALATQTRTANLIATKGQAVTLTYHASGAYDPTTGTIVLTDTTVATTGVLLPLPLGLRHMAGTTIGIDDQRLLLPGSIAKPDLDTTATIGGKLYRITEVSPLSPAGTTLVYECLIRGAP